MFHHLLFSFLSVNVVDSCLYISVSIPSYSANTLLEYAVVDPEGVQGVRLSPNPAPFLNIL